MINTGKRREKEEIVFAGVAFKGLKNSVGINVPLTRFERILRKKGIQITTHGMPNDQQLSPSEVLEIVDDNRDIKNIASTVTYLPTKEILYTTSRGKLSFEVKELPQTTALVHRDIP